MTQSTGVVDKVDLKALRAAITNSAETIAGLAGQVDAIGRICDGVVRALKRGNKLLTAGNGGSAAEALHMAEELVGRFRNNRVSLPAVSLVADTTALTCIANDYGYDFVFSRQVEGLAQKGDVLVLFSTSGRAKNLSLALEEAKARGVEVVCFLGKDGGALAGRGDLECIVKSESTERIQESHQVLLHLVLDAVEKAYAAPLL